MIKHNSKNPHCPCDDCCISPEELRAEYLEWDEEVNGEEKRKYFESFQNAVTDCMKRAGRI